MAAEQAGDRRGRAARSLAVRPPRFQSCLAVARRNGAGHGGGEQVFTRLGARVALRAEQRAGVLGHARAIARRDGAEKRDPALLESVQGRKAARALYARPERRQVLPGEERIDGLGHAQRAVQPNVVLAGARHSSRRSLKSSRSFCSARVTAGSASVAGASSRKLRAYQASRACSSTGTLNEPSAASSAAFMSMKRWRAAFKSSTG